jgi:hypothetical protein
VSDPVARRARYFAVAFREKKLDDVADMLDYLADQADKEWDRQSAELAERAGPGATP